MRPGLRTQPGPRSPSADCDEQLFRVRRPQRHPDPAGTRAAMKISQRARNTAPSPTLGITARARQLKAQGIDVIGFGAGEPDFDTPDPIKRAAIAALEGGDTKYTPSSGTEALRKAICEKLRQDNGLSYQPNEVIVSVGA